MGLGRVQKLVEQLPGTSAREVTTPISSSPGFKTFLMSFPHAFITHLTFSVYLIVKAMIKTIFNTRGLEEMLLIITPGIRA